MGWKPDRKRPICPQICERVCVRIARGELEPHGRMPSVRELAVELGVNPNTAQRSFELLEQQGVLYSVPGTGWYVSADTAVAQSTVQAIIADKTRLFFEEMFNLGLGTDAVKQTIKEWQYE